ncbi:MAG TPA: hypothetical protein VF932_15155 [Anaerolineae bacterium]
MRNRNLLSALLLADFVLIGVCYLALALALNLTDDANPATVEIVPAAESEIGTPLVTVIVVTRVPPSSTPTFTPTSTPTHTPSISPTPSRTPTDEPTKPPYVFSTPIPVQPTLPATRTPVRKRVR